MADVHDSETRSYNMSRIKGTDTKPEMIVRKYLHANGLRYSLHNKKLTGKPDLTLAKYSTIIFVNGCFWHGHKGCKYFVMPKTRTEWWKEKIDQNIKRDRKSLIELEKNGWNSLVIWECQLRPKERISTLEYILKTIIKEAKI
jgi:DNA mismatch endonuclease (patch repair protein)